ATSNDTKPTSTTAISTSPGTALASVPGSPTPHIIAAHPCDADFTVLDTLRARDWGGEPLYGRGQQGCLKDRAASPVTNHHPHLQAAREKVQGARHRATTKPVHPPCRRSPPCGRERSPCPYTGEALAGPVTFSG